MPVDAAPLAIGILFALPEEARPFQRILKASEGCISGRSVRVACSGVGMVKAAHSAEEMDLSSLQCLVVCGFGGGLRPDIAPGDLVLADTVLDIPADAPITCMDSPLLATAESFRTFLQSKPTQSDKTSHQPATQIRLHRGTLATGNRILVTRAEKKSLWEQTGAIAVDMETAGAIRVAARHNVPWLAVRAISDSANEDMPLDFNTLANANGDPDIGRVILVTLTHPWKIPALIRLGSRSSLAAQNLALFLEAFIRATASTERV